MISFVNKAMLSISLLASLVACSKDNNKALMEPPPQTTFHLYPKPKQGWVGDVMPYYKNGKFEIYYLNDATDWEKQSSSGQHPIFKMSTANLVDVTDDGEVIPYGNIHTQDHLIGTGSLLDVGNKSYFYYTGHNGSSSWLTTNNPNFTSANPREAVMVAQRTDGKSWVKQMHPVLIAPAGYALNEFRDPYAFYNSEFGEYWMLVSGQRGGKGYLLCYTTKDPDKQDWQFQGPLDVEGDYLMLECADIFKIGSTYYLLFSEDWSDSRGTHYRVANSTKGVWKAPERDKLDGLHFYAAKTATDGQHRYAFAWAHRRNPEQDAGALTWGGNLVSHEIYALADQKLGVKIPQAVVDKVNKPIDLQAISATGTVVPLNRSTAVDSNTELQFGAVLGTQRVEMTLQAAQKYTLKLGQDYTISIDPVSGSLQGISNGRVVTAVTFSPSDQQKLQLLCDGSIVMVYLNDEVALTNRIYSLQERPWSILNGGGALMIKSIKRYGLQ